MAGSPKKRARREAAMANGQAPTPAETQVGYLPRSKLKNKYEVVVEIIDGEEVPKIISKPKLNPGRTPEELAVIRAKKDAMIARGELIPGRPRTKFSRAEATERALARLEPQALKVLADQVNDENLDPGDRRAAAIKILEYRRGKPTQAIKVDGQQVTTIRFETAAWVAGMHKASSASLESADMLELPPGSVEELAEQE